MLLTFLMRLVDFQHQLNQQDGLPNPLVGECNRMLGSRVDIQDFSTCTSLLHCLTLIRLGNWMEYAREITRRCSDDESSETTVVL